MKTARTITGTWIVALLVFAVAQGAYAADITWDTPQDISGNPSDVSTNGNLVAAYGAQGTTTQSLNSVEFTGEIPGVAVDEFDKEYQHGRFAAGLTNPSDYFSLMVAADANSVGTATIRLSGLTSGLQYEVQIWCCDSGSTPTDRWNVYTAGNASDNVLWEVSNAQPGQYIIGTFTADAVTQDIGVESNGGWEVVNALQVRYLPPTVVPGTLIYGK